MVAHAPKYLCHLTLLLIASCLLAGEASRDEEKAESRSLAVDQTDDAEEEARSALAWQELKKDFKLHKAPRLSLLVTATTEGASGRQIVLFTAPPAGGKGTQAKRIAAALKIPHLSTGDMLRAEVEAGSDVGKAAQEIMSSGGLVGDELVVAIVKSRVSKDDCKGGFILDGFPRTLPQAEALDKMLQETGDKVTTVVNMVVPDEEVVKRVTGRWIHKKSGRSYHAQFKPPKSLGKGQQASAENMKDDETGEPLEQRADDTAEAAVARIAKYKNETQPIVAHYKQAGKATIVHDIDGNQNVDDVTRAIANALAGGDGKGKEGGVGGPHSHASAVSVRSVLALWAAVRCMLWLCPLAIQ